MTAFALPGTIGAHGDDWEGPFAPALSGVKAKLKGTLRGGMVLALTAFTNAATAVITNRVIQAGTPAKYISWGTGGATAAAVTQTALTTETTYTTTSTNGSGGATNTRTTGTESRSTTTQTNDTYTVTGTMTSSAAQTISESGLFDQVAAGGNMFLRSSFTGIALAVADSIAFTFNFQLVPVAA